ncbi:MAG: phosphate signaling complex protein PhoU [Verrucomicrobia bacterium]|nr:phosphate signaling complex protein PhoU [Kiritimatiellia bacterium]MCP5488826.1 phosphate signaling complex protein PhoU [Verrucomicrobiota bacterium]
MAIHLVREIEKLKKQILSLSAHVEENVRQAIKSVTERDESLARKCIEEDKAIDIAEVDIEEECLKIFALHQPVAHDLRYLVAILKINRDLERISDIGVSIAQRAIDLCSLPEPTIDFNIGFMAEKVQTMFSQSLDALINRDSRLARETWFADDEIDTLCAENYTLAEQQITKTPEQTRELLNLLSISRSLERMADHVANISKDVIYMIEGEIVRHRKKIIKERIRQAEQSAE